MAKRRETRVPFAAPVRVSGTRRDGTAFTAMAYTVDISRHGVRLGEASFLDDCKDLLTLQYMHRRAQFRVTWRGDAGTSDRGMVGLTILPNQPALLWGVDPGGRPDQFEASVASVAIPVPTKTVEAAVPEPPMAARSAQPMNSPEKRATPRFDCDRAAICWRKGELVPVWGKLRDVSAGGCFVETTVPFAVGTAVAVTLLLYGVKVRSRGTVRSAGSKGMGIQFREVHARDVRKFLEVLNRLADPDQLPAYSSVLGPGESAFQKIKEWFREHDNLSHDEFVELIVSLHCCETA